MRFVIVGGGRVGTRTARVLEAEDHDATILERRSERVDKLRKEGFDVVQGDGSTEDDLLGLNLEGADGVAALTGDVTVNLITCLIAKANDCRTVLRVDNDKYEMLCRKYGSEIDMVIYPERLGAIAAKNALLGGNIRAIADIAKEIQLTEFTITEESPMRGYTLSELELPANAQVLGFGKAGESIDLPMEDESLELGDRLIVIAHFEVLGDVRRIIVGENTTPSSPAPVA
ncbi:potassium channel family protein [Halocatena pleomorpha]|uniref:TrkA family potassium uptake protein n=1 Tax=Halocatena pleomorpha TaxID=1785090 RepID=A0A3P3RHX3_9EURY|nr:TrkA family potassium uptake protein [Halocatena pleomorpha]RRJ32370.1 TrkA family potassium uptake protein [Halocatena pleomorpha]